MTIFAPSTSPNRGFTLLEVILAIAIFSMAAVSLVQALNTIGVATIEASDQHAVDLQIKGLLNEFCFDPFLKTGITKLKDLDEIYNFEVEVDEANLSNEEGANLEEMFTVRVRAFKKGSQSTKSKVFGSAERTVYRRLWRENRLNQPTRVPDVLPAPTP